MRKLLGDSSNKRIAELEALLKQVTLERDNLIGVVNTYKQNEIAYKKVINLLLQFYKDALVKLSFLNNNYPCVQCAYRVSATQCTVQDCKSYSRWVWKMLKI